MREERYAERSLCLGPEIRSRIYAEIKQYLSFCW